MTKRLEDSTRSRYGSGSLRKRGNIFWIRYRHGGVQYQESTGSDDRDYAIRFLNKKLDALGSRRSALMDPAKVSYEQMRENYLAHCLEDRDPPMRSLTKDRDGNPTLPTLPRLDAFFGGWKAADITTDVIRRFRREGKLDGLSDKRMNRYVATLSAMFHWAAKDGKITAAEMPAYFPKTPEKNEAVGAIFIKPEWYKPLREELDEPLRSAFTLAYHVSIRVYEMRRLRWRDVDPKKRFITLPGSITKTGKQRIVPLPSDFDLKPGKADDLVFPLGDRRDQWRSACVKIGAACFECRECRARCKGRECPEHGKLAIKRMLYVGPTLRHTRHTAVRNMSDAGLEEKRIMDISGHVTRSMFDRYNIGKEQDVQEAGRIIEQFHRKAQKRKKRGL